MSGGGARRAPFARALDLAAALRPHLWIPAILLFEAGRVAPSATRGTEGFPPGVRSASWPGPEAWILLGALLAWLGAVHVGNAWRDRRSDRANRKAGPFAAGRLSDRSAAALAAACAAAAAAAAWHPDVTNESRFLGVAAVLLGILYVLPPFEAKRRAGIDLMVQAAGYGLVAFLLGASAPMARWPSLLLDAAPYATGIAAVSLLTMIADREGDLAAGQITTAVRTGAARAQGLAVGLAGVTAAWGLERSDAVPALWGIAAVAWIALAPALETHRAQEGWIRDAVVLQLLLAALLLPRTVLPLLAALAIGGAAAVASGLAGGSGYPLRLFRGGRGSGEDAGG